LVKTGTLPSLDYCLRIEVAEVFDQTADQTRPPRLMTGPDTGTIIAVKIFVKQQVVTPTGVVLKFRGTAKHRPTTGVVAQKETGKPVGNLASDLNKFISLPDPVGHSILKLLP